MSEEVFQPALAWSWEERELFHGPWRARVELNIDPLGIGRVRVRVPHIHGPSVTDVADVNLVRHPTPALHGITTDTLHLPWALPCFPIDMFNVPAMGSWVWVFFEDNDPNFPVYFGWWPALAPQQGFQNIPNSVIPPPPPPTGPDIPPPPPPPGEHLYKNYIRVTHGDGLDGGYGVINSAENPGGGGDGFGTGAGITGSTSGGLTGSGGTGSSPASGDTSAFAPLFNAAGATTGVDPLLLEAIAINESSLDPNAVSPVNSNGTIDYGLMQINSANGGSASMTPAQNINAGATIFAADLAQQGGNVDSALTEYNSGHGGSSQYATNVLATYASLGGTVSHLVRDVAKIKFAASTPATTLSDAARDFRRTYNAVRGLSMNLAVPSTNGINGVASVVIVTWYGPAFFGKLNATGGIYTGLGMTAATALFDLGTVVNVTDTSTGKVVQVVVNDYFPRMPERGLVLSQAAATALEGSLLKLGRIKAVVVPVGLINPVGILT